MKKKRRKILIKYTIVPIFLLVTTISLMSFSFIDVTNGNGGKIDTNDERNFTTNELQDLTKGIFSYVKQWNNKRVNGNLIKKNIRYQYFYTLQNMQKDAIFKIDSDQIEIKRTGTTMMNSEIWITFFNIGEYDYSQKNPFIQRKWLNKLLEHYSLPITDIVIPYEYNRISGASTFVELFNGSNTITSQSFNPNIDGDKYPFYSLSVYDEIGISNSKSISSSDDYLNKHHTSIISFRFQPMRIKTSSGVVIKTLKESTFSTTSLERYTIDNSLNEAMKYIIQLLNKKDLWLINKNKDLDAEKVAYEDAKKAFFQLNKDASDYQQKREVYLQAYETYFKSKNTYSKKNTTTFKWGNINENDENDQFSSGKELFSNLLDKLLISFLKDSAAYKNEEYNTKKQYYKDSKLFFSNWNKT